MHGSERWFDLYSYLLDHVPGETRDDKFGQDKDQRWPPGAQDPINLTNLELQSCS